MRSFKCNNQNDIIRLISKVMMIKLREICRNTSLAKKNITQEIFNVANSNFDTII